MKKLLFVMMAMIVVLLVAVYLAKQNSANLFIKNILTGMNSSIKIKLEPKPVVIGLPRNAQIEYFGKIDKERFFVVWRPKKDDWGYKDLNLVVGSANDLKTIRIDKVERFPDGGSTFIYTAIGKFFFAPWGKHEGDLKGQPFLEFYYSAYDDIYDVGN